MKKPTNFTLSLVDPIAASLVLKHERNFPANARDEILARTEDNHDFDFIADPRDLVSRIFRRNGRVGTYYGESWDEILAYNAKQVAAGTPSNCVAFEDSAGTIPLVAPLGSGKGCGLLKDRSGGGNHRIQTSATARGEMSRRVNLSPQGVTGGSAGIIGSGGVLPSGVAINNSAGLTHEVLATDLSPALGGGCRIRISGTAASSAVYRLKLNEAVNSVSGGTLLVLKQALTIRSGEFPAGSSPVVYFVNVGVATAIGASVGGVLGDTVYSPIPYASASSGVYSELRFTTIAGQSVDVTIEFAATDIRLASDAIASMPAYQRVTSASDYDEEGFPAFLRRQTDDWSKAHINPNGATKVFALTAIQKIRDAALGAVLELGTNPASGSGNFSVLAPATVGPTYSMGSKGSTALVSTLSDSTFPAPVRSLVVGIGDIANDGCSLTVNGTTTTNTSDQGTGTYTEQDVFFGARAGTSMFVNDREYSPPMILFMQPSDPGISAAAIRKLTKLFSKGIGL